MIVFRRACFAAVFLLAVCAVSGCRSPHVEVTVENRTGAEVRLLEVDYPSASFGKDSLAPGAVYHYRIQVSDTGPVKVQYTDPGSRQPQVSGPSLAEGDKGSLQIALLPNGKAQFNLQLAGHP